MHRLLMLAISGILWFTPANAQTWSVRVSGNEYYPLNSNNKSQYPILWYAGKDDRGVLLGGLGVGVSYQHGLGPDVSLKYQLNAQRSLFYDEPYLVTDGNGQGLQAIIGINTHYNAVVFCLPQYAFGQWALGAGLGGRFTVFSSTDYGEAIVEGVKRELKLETHALSPIVVILPVELSFQPWDRWSFALRAELGLTKASRIPGYASERGLSTVVEIGYRFGKTASE